MLEKIEDFIKEKGADKVGIVVMVVMAVIVAGASYYVTKDSHNPVEEFAEEVIEEELHLPKGYIEKEIDEFSHSQSGGKH